MKTGSNTLNSKNNTNINELNSKVKNSSIGEFYDPLARNTNNLVQSSKNMKKNNEQQFGMSITKLNKKEPSSNNNYGSPSYGSPSYGSPSYGSPSFGTAPSEKNPKSIFNNPDKNAPKKFDYLAGMPKESNYLQAESIPSNSKNKQSLTINNTSSRLKDDNKNTGKNGFSTLTNNSNTIC